MQEQPDIPAIIDYTDEDDASKTECNKDTGTCRNRRGVILLLSMVVATLTLGSPSTSKYLIIHLSDQHMHSSIYGAPCIIFLVLFFPRSEGPVQAFPDCAGLDAVCICSTVQGVKEKDLVV